MSLLGKYRREESDKDDETSDKPAKARQESESTKSSMLLSAVPNKERKSPMIVSFSIPTDLRSCLQAIRKTKSINLSMWVENQLRDAVAKEFPQIAEEYLE